MSESNNDAPASEAQPAGNKRKRVLSIIALAFVSVGLLWAIYHFAYGRYHVTTDNAYVGGNMVEITPQVGGTVTRITVDDNDYVKAGQVLVELDTSDSDIALAQADAELARTVREVRTMFANTEGFRAQVAARQADLSAARSAYERARTEYERRADLKDTGAVGGEELANARLQMESAAAQVKAAEQAVAAAREQLSANRAQIEGTDVSSHPRVQAAAANVRAAYLQRERQKIVSPISGYVARRSVQLGQRLQAGTPLMAVIALNDVWVDANYKEVEIEGVHIGQPVTLESDLYGGSVEYHGTVEGIGSGTGSAFSLLPAQNATGNWIKVVQRVPVRIKLNPDELQKHPLRIGLSMKVNIDSHDQSGPRLAAVPRENPAYQTQVYDRESASADQHVAQIINANLGESRVAKG
ncbi:MAG TPA: biotin/lipoyl-binding protein [Steroidobacteraceae bacterium]|nr:biotin/lipoyl-binding protein [Steroidobacteraceae bacterium]